MLFYIVNFVPILFFSTTVNNTVNILMLKDVNIRSKTF